MFVVSTDVLLSLYICTSYHVNTNFKLLLHVVNQWKKQVCDAYCEAVLCSAVTSLAFYQVCAVAIYCTWNKIKLVFIGIMKLYPRESLSARPRTNTDLKLLSRYLSGKGSILVLERCLFPSSKSKNRYVSR